MTVLITGATGLLGRHVLAELGKRRQDILVLSRRPLESQEFGFRTITADLSQKGFAKRLPRGVTRIIHLAQSSRYRDFPSEAQDVFDVNLQSTQELLQYGEAIQIEQFIYASSGGVYKAGALGLREDTPLRAPDSLDFYLSTKLASELLVQSYRSIFRNTVLRFFFIYGPGQRRSMLLPRLFDSVAENRLIQLGGQDGIIVNPVHATDAAKAVVAATELSDSTTINVGGPNQYSLRQICELFGRELNRAPRFELKAAVGEDRLVADIEKMSDVLVTPKVNLEASMMDFLSGRPAV